MRNAYAFRRTVVNTYLVRERDRRLLRELAVVLLAVATLGGGLLGYTWLQLEARHTGVEIDRLERQLRELAETERTLRLEVAYAASPAQLEKRAVAELGMQPPTLEQVIFWEELP